MNSKIISLIAVLVAVDAEIIGHGYSGHEDVAQFIHGHQDLNQFVHDQGHHQLNQFAHGHGHEEHPVDYHSHPKYEFSYGVKDDVTGDEKTQQESRDGDTVRGSYTVVEPDGHKRIVEYQADSHNGFQATVRREPVSHAAISAAFNGHNQHHQHQHGIEAAQHFDPHLFANIADNHLNAIHDQHAFYH